MRPGIRPSESLTLCLCITLLAATSPLGAAPALPALVDLSLDQENSRVLGDDSDDRTGRTTLLEDLDGDRFADLILGGPTTNRGTAPILDNVGEVAVDRGMSSYPTVIDLSLSPNSPDEMRVLGHDEGAMLGDALAAGDLNGDGLRDLAIGSPNADVGSGGDTRLNAGEIAIVFGSITLPQQVDTETGQENVTISGPDAGDNPRAGWALAIGDFDADGFNDLVIGAPESDPEVSAVTRFNAGLVFIVYGRSSWPSSIDLETASGLTRIIGDTNGDELGRALAVGDVNGDGFADILIGAPMGDRMDPSQTQAGEAYIIRGRSSRPATIDLRNTEEDVRFLGVESDDNAGTAVALGDIDGDGRADVIVGAPFTDQSGADADAGQVFVWFGRTVLPPVVDFRAGAADIMVLGNESDDLVGDPIAAGDLDGDGFDELLVGIPEANPGTPNGRGNAGEVAVFFGSALSGMSRPATIDLELTAAPTAIHGDDTNDRWGSGIAAGDANRDGFEDLIVGGPDSDPGPSGTPRNQAGEVALILGGGDALSATRSRYDRADDAPPGDFGPAVRVEIDYAAGTGPSLTTATLTREAATGLPSGASTVRWEITTDRTGWGSASLSLFVNDLELTQLDGGTHRIYQGSSAAGPWTALPTTFDQRSNRFTAEVTSLRHFAVAPAKASATYVDFILGLEDQVPFDTNGDGVIDIADVVNLILMGN